MPVMQRIFLTSLLLLVSACFAADIDYVSTDKIHLLLHNEETGEYDVKQNIISNAEQVPLSLRMDISNITHVEVRDVSSKNICERNNVPNSPSTIASFKLDPKLNIKKIDFRIKLPCAAYDREFYIQVKVRSPGGKYVMKMKVPTIISIPGDGA